MGGTGRSRPREQNHRGHGFDDCEQGNDDNHVDEAFPEKRSEAHHALSGERVDKFPTFRIEDTGRYRYI
jgi:hypothetical protein